MSSRRRDGVGLRRAGQGFPAAPSASLTVPPPAGDGAYREAVDLWSGLVSVVSVVEWRERGTSDRVSRPLWLTRKLDPTTPLRQVGVRHRIEHAFEHRFRSGGDMQAHDLDDWTRRPHRVRRPQTDAERIDTLRRLEVLKCAAEALQAEVTAAFDASQRAEQAAAGTPQERQGRGVAGQVALARRESPHRAQRHVGLAVDPGHRAAAHDGRVPSRPDHRVGRHRDRPRDRLPHPRAPPRGGRAACGRPRPAGGDGDRGARSRSQEARLPARPGVLRRTPPTEPRKTAGSPCGPHPR